VLVGDQPIRREHASLAGLARQLGTTRNTVWTSIRPLLKAMADDETRFAGVRRLGVDEHVWHHASALLTEAVQFSSPATKSCLDHTPRALAGLHAALT
jgi:transposase